MKVLIYSMESSKSYRLKTVLLQNGIFSDFSTTESQLFTLYQTEHYAAVILSGSHHPTSSGGIIKVWKKLGSEGLLIYLAEKDTGLSRSEALDLGVDYYFHEPYSYTQLITEIKLHEYHRQLIKRSAIKTNYFEVDLLSRMAYCNNQYLELTKVEFDILALMIRMKGMVLSRVQIWEEIWGYQDYPLTNIIDVHLNRLRSKLPSTVAKLILTVYGIGYRLHDSA